MQDLLIDTNIYAYAMKGDPDDEDTAEFYSTILNELRKIGRPIPTNDIWIASVAFQHGLRMFTRDSHFTYISGLVVVS